MDFALESRPPVTDDKVEMASNTDEGLGAARQSGPQQEHVRKVVDALKRSASLAGRKIEKKDIRIGKKVIIVDDRIR